MTIRMGIATALAVLLMVAATVLMVMPGFYLFRAADLPFGPVLGEFHGDNWLPIAMRMQLFWAPVLPFGLWVADRVVRRDADAGRARRHRVRRECLRLALAVSLACAWAVLLALGLHWQAVTSGL